MWILTKLRETLNSRLLLKNSFLLTAGALVSQAVPVLVSPLLTRLYVPGDYGALALFMSLLSILSMIASLRYELTIVLPKEDDRAVNLAALSFIIVTVFTVILLGAVLIFRTPLNTIFHLEKLSFFIYLIPLMFFSTGITQILNYWIIREKAFSRLTAGRILQSLSGSGVNLGMGAMKTGYAGLLTGALTAQLAIMGLYVITSWNRFKSRLPVISRKTMKSAALEYRDFPLFNTLQALMDVLREALFVILVTLIYNQSILGLYSFTLRILKSPAAIIGSSFAQVFYQHASQLTHSQVNLRPLMVKTAFRLALIAFPFFAVIGIFGPDLFAWIFGDKWRDAGSYSRILSPWLWLNFIASPLSQIPVILKKQKTSAVITFFYSLAMLAPLAGGYFYQWSIEKILGIITGLMCIILLIMIGWIWKIAGEKRNDHQFSPS
jgi:O-antigen/teichoic acid export membrane protein